MERFQEEAMAWQAKKQNSSNKCCKDLVGILKDNEHEDNEISEDEDDTAWIYVTYVIFMYVWNVYQLTQI